MRQDVGRIWIEVVPDRNRRSGFWLVPRLSGSIFLTLVVAANASAQVGDPDKPELARPNEMPKIVSTPATPPPAPTTGPAVLALPGITAPASPRPSTTLSPLTSSPTDLTDGDDLKLDAPREMRGTPSQVTPLPRVSPAPANRRSQRPLTLEHTDEDPLPIDNPAVKSSPDTKRSSTINRIEPQPAAPLQKRTRFFGLLPGPAASPTVTNNATANSGSAMTGKPNASGRSIVEENSVETSAEATLKRRIEKQAREAIGDRARSIEVRVVGKSAVVQARGVKLFQKRNVRKSLEGIPALTGLRSTIEVVD